MLWQLVLKEMFQHSAARRRLAFYIFVSDNQTGFNTQPPEGG